MGRYFSDYDLLVVVDHEDLTDVPEFWAKTEDRLLEELSAGKILRTPVSVIYHSIGNSVSDTEFRFLAANRIFPLALGGAV